MSSLDDVDDKTGLNLLKLLDGEKALHGEKSPGQGPLMISNPVDFPTDLGSFGNEFRLPKGNFEFGSSSGVLAIAQSLNADMERILCNLRAENEDLKAKCESTFSSYNNTLSDLNKSKPHEVLKKGIPRALKRVFMSDEFQREILKLLLMMLEENRHQNPQNDFVPARVTKAIVSLKNIKWGCMNDVIGAPVSLPRYVLRRHGEHSGQGPSA
ncbi:hypothetical protein Tco_0635072 [Tanacetum coccineum]